MQSQPRTKTSRKQTGIEPRHARSCASRDGGRCNCQPTFQANVWSSREGKRIRKTFPTLTAAKAWRADAIGAVRRGTMRAPSPVTVKQAAEAWLEAAKSGAIRTRSGDLYKPSALRGYETSLTRRVLPALGRRRLSELTRVDLQDFAERLAAEGLDPSTVRNALMPLRAIFRRALARGEVSVNPTAGLELAAVRGTRDRIASPAEMAQLIAALPEGDRALWATAAYAGLRRGELLALRWEDVDLAGGVIRVERSWDEQEGAIEPKSRAGRRSVPIPAVLRDALAAHKMLSGRSAGLVFGSSATQPFTPKNVRLRARAAWDAADPKLTPIGLHEARHTFASLMIAAGVNARALAAYMGHSSIALTMDRYGHLMPGNEAEAAGLLDLYLERADTAARLAQLGA